MVQGRLSGVQTDTVVLTNLSRDHLDYHHTMDAYGAAKRLTMKLPGVETIVLNGDDEESRNWLRDKPSGADIIWCAMALPESISSEDRHCLATNVQYHQNGCQFRLETSWGTTVVNVPLLGKFNIYNLLSAVAVVLSQGERFDDVVRLLSHLTPVAGRMEVFPFSLRANVVVDYAHTPDALEQLLSSAKAHTTGKIWCVFGCGGDRDRGKRPLMAKAAERYADHIIITTDNSRSESPKTIAEDIRKGLSSFEIAKDEPDRERAIRWCLEKAAADDLIIVAGKGHENYQIIGNDKTDYDERAVVARLQKEYSK